MENKELETPRHGNGHGQSVATTDEAVPSARELGQRAGDLAKDASRSAIHGINEVGARGMHAAGQRVDRAAESLEQQGQHLATSGDAPVAPEQVSAVTGGIRRAGHYLQERDPKGVASDIDRAVHGHPYRAMLIAGAVGWVAGRFIFGRDR